MARNLAMRAAEYLRRGQLTLSLFSPMLEAARFALNVRPRIGLDSLIFGNIGSPSIFGDDIGLAYRECVAALVPPPLGAVADLPDLVYVVSDEDTTAASSVVVDLKPSALALDRGPFLLRGKTVPLASDSGAFLRIDTGAQLDLHAHTLPTAHAAVAE